MFSIHNIRVFTIFQFASPDSHQCRPKLIQCKAMKKFDAEMNRQVFHMGRVNHNHGFNIFKQLVNDTPQEVNFNEKAC